jgi:hypothetical protein
MAATVAAAVHNVATGLHPDCPTKDIEPEHPPAAGFPYPEKTRLNSEASLECSEANPSEESRTYSSLKDGVVTVSSKLDSEGGWVPNSQNTGEYMTLDLGRAVSVSGLVTQGGFGRKSWVTEYKVEYKIDTDDDWEPMAETFEGNTDVSSKKSNSFATARSIRYIRVLPTKWHGGSCVATQEWKQSTGHAWGDGLCPDMTEDDCHTHCEWKSDRFGMRMGVLECDWSHGCDSNKVMIPKIEDFTFTSSWQRASRAKDEENADPRLYGAGWCAGYKDGPEESAQYVEMDLQSVYPVIGLKLQGVKKGDTASAVSKYTFGFSQNGVDWETYKNPIESGLYSNDISDDHDLAVRNEFDNFIDARYIRVYPLISEGATCMRIGVIVCDKGGGWEDAKHLTSCEPSEFVANSKSNPPSTGLQFCQQKCQADDQCTAIHGNAILDRGDQSCYMCKSVGFKEVEGGDSSMMKRVRDDSNVGIDGCVGTYWCQELMAAGMTEHEATSCMVNGDMWMCANDETNGFSSTCVGYGKVSTAQCNRQQLVCGTEEEDGSASYGSIREQAYEVLGAKSGGGLHPSCPSDLRWSMVKRRTCGLGDMCANSRSYGSIVLEDAEDTTECREKCAEQRSCNGFVVDLITRECFMKSDVECGVEPSNSHECWTVKTDPPLSRITTQQTTGLRQAAQQDSLRAPGVPTPEPTPAPTGPPTVPASPGPTPQPTPHPTWGPTPNPTPSPTYGDIVEETLAPTPAPTYDARLTQADKDYLKSVVGASPVKGLEGFLIDTLKGKNQQTFNNVAAERSHQEKMDAETAYREATAALLAKSLEKEKEQHTSDRATVVVETSLQVAARKKEGRDRMEHYKNESKKLKVFMKTDNKNTTNTVKRLISQQKTYSQEHDKTLAEWKANYTQEWADYTAGSKANFTKSMAEFTKADVQRRKNISDELDKTDIKESMGSIQEFFKKKAAVDSQKMKALGSDPFDEVGGEFSSLSAAAITTAMPGKMLPMTLTSQSYRCKGDSIGKLGEGLTEEECTEACLKKVTCEYVAYNDNKKECYEFATCATDQKDSPWKWVVYEKISGNSKMALPTKYYAFQNRRCAGAPMSLGKGKTSKECKDSCLLKAGCSAAGFNLDTKTCNEFQSCDSEFADPKAEWLIAQKVVMKDKYINVKKRCKGLPLAANGMPSESAWGLLGNDISQDECFENCMYTYGETCKYAVYYTNSRECSQFADCKEDEMEDTNIDWAIAEKVGVNGAAPIR